MAEPFTNEHFVNWCRRMIGQPYWYGATAARCTEDLLTRKRNQYPAHYTSDRMSRYRNDIATRRVACDCVGAVKGYMWTDGGVGTLEAIGTGKSYQSRYGANGCPDKSANGMFEYAKQCGCEWGVISTIPEIPGIAVRFDGHIGYYIGGGEVIEWRGFAYGCVKTKLNARKWLHWYKLPFIKYGTVTAPAKPENTRAARTEMIKRTLRKGCVGEDVRILQTLLIERGYDVGKDGADGDFGRNTDDAVRRFQRDHDLEVDGIVGKMTKAELAK